MRKQVEKTISTILHLKEIVGALAAIALWVLALWLTNQLAPLAQDISILDSRISAVESIQEGMSGDVTNIGEDVTKIKCYLLKEGCLD